jgi:hypothetical protein
VKLFDVKPARARISRALLKAAGAVAPRAEQDLNAHDDERFHDETLRLWNLVRSRTMTSIFRIDALRAAVEYVEANSIAGAIVECGVWRGGSMMAAAVTLLRLSAERSLWLYDTFAGNPPPGEVDKDFLGRAAADLLATESPETSRFWARSTLEDVKAGMAETLYPSHQINYIVGLVETTIPETVPDEIALLRLDTDWFSSTYHELVHLWPRISSGGVLVIDDYGYWAGAKQAVDQFFRERGMHPYLRRIDDTGRLIIKCRNTVA